MASLLRTDTYEWGDCKFYLRGATIMSEIDKEDLRQRIEPLIDKKRLSYLESYLEAVTQTERTEGLEFDMPPANADADEHLEVFGQFVLQPYNMIAGWLTLARILNLPPKAKPELAPGVETKDPKSGSSAPPSSSA